MRLGPVGLTPFVVVSDVGIDSNVNYASQDPQRDFTARIRPGVDSSLRLGRGRLTGRTVLGFSYFHEAKRFRARDLRQEAGLALVSYRLTPRVGGMYESARERPTLEIDAYVRRTEQRVGVGLDLRLSPRLTVELDARERRREYEDEQFEGANLRTELNQRTEQVDVALRVALTPLTTFVVNVDAARDRFPSAPFRNTDSTGVLPGFELKPFALISGTAFVGYRRVDALEPAVPDFSGVVGNMAVAYTLRGRTRFDLSARRGIEYSYDAQRPYYVVEGAALTVTEALGRRWDVRATYGADSLNYRDRSDGPIAGARRGVDRASARGIGVGHRFGSSARIGFDLTYFVRRSPVTTREYEGWRGGGSFTYGS